MSLYEHKLHPHKPRNINLVHRETFTVNDRIALWVSRRVGTMWFCYALAILMTLWGAINVGMGKNAVDPYPFSFLFFCLGGIMQSILMPLIIVAQNLDAHHQELQVEEQFKTEQKTSHDIEQIMHHLDAQDHFLVDQIKGHLTRQDEVIAELQATILALQETRKVRVTKAREAQ